MENDILYDEMYYKEHETGFKSEERMDHRKIMELLKIKPENRVLEVGCGFGVLLKNIPTTNKMGIETNDVAIKECEKKGLHVIKVNTGEALPFEDSSFDIVIMNEVIEHIKDPEFVLKECFRVLSSEGKIIITTPVRNFFVHDLFPTPTHFSEVTVKEARALMSKCGFKILSHEASNISFVYPLFENFLFKPFRLLRGIFGKNKGMVGTIDSCHSLADRSILRPFSCYRKYALWLGQNQIILGQKSNKI